MPDDLLLRLERYGASTSQLVDLSRSDEPRALRYVDLVRTPEVGRSPVVLESQGQPRAFFFDAAVAASEPTIRQWVRRIAFRGDAEWVGVIRPGRVDMFRASLAREDPRRPLEPAAINVPQGAFLLPSLLHESLPAPGKGVRSQLLKLLGSSIQRASEIMVDGGRVRSGDASESLPDALSLVGRALLWRFLVDRGLLDGLDRSLVCPGADDWASCLSTKTNALKTFSWLDDTFNGGLLPFSEPPRNLPAEVFREVLGNIAYSATPSGQLPLRLPLAWQEVNFAHVPVGLLSEVYEAYAHSASPENARAESVFYTPRAIAEYVAAEALEAVSEVVEPRVLDPAAGAGVFLVAVFRALVVREWHRTGKRPSRAVVRRILNRQLIGFDINDAALRLAELALYLTAIELDPEARPRPLRLLCFDKLRGSVLLKRAGGPAEGSLTKVEATDRGAFDVVLGNPPWTAKATLQAKAKWVQATVGVVTERLGIERAKAFDFPDANPDLPFVFRAMEWAKPGGAIALVTNARWLFQQKAKAIQVRRDILESVHVTGILNGAGLRRTNVWPNIEHPFCLLFAANELPPKHSAFLFVSPDVERTPDAAQQQMRVDWQDATEIDPLEVIAQPWALKVRFRGTPFDRTVLADTSRAGVKLGAYLESLGTELVNGYQAGPRKDQTNPAGHLLGLPDLRGIDPGFLVEIAELPLFQLRKVHRARRANTFRAPLLLVHESVRIDQMSPRAVISFDDVAFDERFDGASFAGIPDGGAIACYLQVFLQSSLVLHALLLRDGQFGVEREVVHLDTLREIPVIPWALLSAKLRRRVSQLAERMRSKLTVAVQAEIDAFACDLFSLSDVQRQSIADTLATRLPMKSVKSLGLQPTTAETRHDFALTCQDDLRSVLEAIGLIAYVRAHDQADVNAWRFLQVDIVPKKDRMMPTRTIEAAQFADASDRGASSLVVVHVDANTRVLGILDRERYWTKTRARMLAALLLSEGGSHA